MERRQRFSLRKYKVGLASVLIGTIFLGGALTTGIVHADVEPEMEVTASETANPVTSQDVKDAKEASDTAATAVTTQEGVVNQAQADQTAKETAVSDLNQ